MKLEICDFCGKIYGLPSRLQLYEPVGGNLVAEITLCMDCRVKLKKMMDNKKQRTAAKAVRVAAGMHVVLRVH